MYIADLHIHSHYSMATSKDCDAPHLDQWARRKGIGLVGTGDFTHPAWRLSLRESLVEEGNGFYTLRDELRLPDGAAQECPAPRFVVTGEISSIYKRGGKTRKVHNLILLPGLGEAEALAMRLEQVGNIHSDGRPILGLDSYDLLALTLEVCPQAVFIPAHIWTPHFSLFGAFSGFDAIEECFGDLTPEIHALETGLSSDPAMNRRVSALDRYTLVSNSDAHSPAKLGREANLITGEMSFAGLKRALETGEGFSGTLEFFPEEGKYHLDGHRACGVCLTPEETERNHGLCPVCGKRVTIGVEHRVWDLADREEGFMPEKARPFESIVPLPEMIAACIDSPVGGKRTVELYEKMLRELGPEFDILRTCSIKDVRRTAGVWVEEGIRRLREGRITRIPGYDGEFGRVEVFTGEERQALLGQSALFQLGKPDGGKASGTQRAKPKPGISTLPNHPVEQKPMPGLNREQEAAAYAKDPALCVIAGPGTGKTRTLIARIVSLIEQGADPNQITAVTFTNAAAKEMRTRLEQTLGKGKTKGMTIGTFHAVCLKLLDPKPILDEDDQKRILGELLGLAPDSRAVGAARKAISLIKGGASCREAGLEEGIFLTYKSICSRLSLRDFDDLLLDALNVEDMDRRPFTHLLVDEFQDTNPIQQRLVLHWHKGGESLFVIGDPDQSIYGFRGASADCFEALKRELPQLRTITLTDNYRSAPEILSAAVEVIAHNPGGERRLTAQNGDRGSVRLVRMETPFSEGIWIAKEIARLTGGVDMISAGTLERERERLRPFSDIAVLCRTHRQLDLIEECLSHDGIPCLVTGKGDALTDAGAQGALHFFKFLLNGDKASLKECLITEYGCAEEAAWTLAEAWPEEQRAYPEGLLRDMDAFSPLLKKEKPGMLLARWTALHGESPGNARLGEIAAYHRNMEELLNALSLGEEGDIQRENGKSGPGGAVRLMTLHGAKGLEFPVVFLAGISRGMMPLEREGKTLDGQEERRLFFVGMTRAMEELILTAPEPASDYLKELPPAVMKGAVMEKAMARGRQLSLF